MQIFINNEPIEASLEDEKIVGDVLKSFEVTCENNDAAVIGIVIDGKQITADIFDEEAAKTISDDTRIDFTVVTVTQIKESFANLSSLFDELSQKMENIPVILQNGKNAEAAESIKNVADSINQFCHVAALASLFPQTFKETMIDGKNFKEFFEDFSPILLDFESALQNNDTVMIGDLSEYEICPRLSAISSALKDL